MGGKVFSHISIFFANFIYALTYTFAKDVMPDFVSPFAFILMRAVGAVLLFWLTYLLFVREKMERKDLVRAAVAGVFGVALNQLLFFKGLNMTTPINASIIMTSNPIMVLVMSYFILGEKITLRKAIGIILGIIGASTLILNGSVLSLNPDHMLGNFFILINAASYAVFLVVVKPLMQKYNPITVMTAVFTFGTIYVIPFGLDGLLNVKFNELPVTIIYEILFVVIATTYLAYMLNSAALKNLRPSVVSMYIYSQPILATIVAIYLGSDFVTQNKVVSAIIIFVGVYLVSVRSLKDRKQKLS
ncbi:MAG: DMT family transporter [Flavobacteriales bacterium]|nr:DMT family transporter [Flavobacteriales bacterium]